MASLSIAAVAVVIFGLIMWADRDREESEGSKTISTASRPHEALAFSPLPEGETTEITRDGVTILTPPLLVPVITLDPQGSPVPTINPENDANSDRKSPATRKHRHRPSRAYARRAPTERRITGLAANRRVVVDR